MENIGGLTLADHYKMYNVYEDAVDEESLSLLLGYSYVDMYLQDGKVNFNYNGVVQNENGIWYVQGGNVKFDYNGHAYGYYFSGGCAQ